MTHWKPASAFIYSLICLCDFVIFPAYAGVNRPHLTLILTEIQGLDSNVQQAAIRAATAGYEPFTLKGSGLFHLAFGALLTSAAIKNGGLDRNVVYSDQGAEFQRRTDDAKNKTE